MVKPPIEKIRQALVLDAIITSCYTRPLFEEAGPGDRLYQKDIGRRINARFVNHEKDDLDDHAKWKMSQAMISKTVNQLMEEGLITVEVHKIPGRGRPNLIILKKEYETLNKILKLYSNPKFDFLFSKFLNINLLKSEYGKSLINMNLVDKINEENELKLDQKEKEFILNIITFSPHALLHLLMLEINCFPELIKPKLFFDLLNNIGNDLKLDELLITDIPIQYEIKIKFFEEKDIPPKKGNMIEPLSYSIEKNGITSRIRSVKGTCMQVDTLINPLTGEID